MKRNKRTIEIKNGAKYKRVTIKTNNGGVFLRDIEVGEKIGTKNQFTIKEGQFLVSKIDARNGAFGVVTNEVDEAIITGNFWAFDVDYSLINPHYLALITTTPEFIKFCENSSTGTTNRHYLQEDLFLAVEIPLPPLDDKDAEKRNLPNAVTQKKLVEEYNHKIAEAEAAKIKAKEKESEIEKYLMGELGIGKSNIGSKKQGLHFTKFKDLYRWDAEYILNEKVTLNSQYPLVEYSNLFTNLYNGIPARNYASKGIRFLKVADIKHNYIDDSNTKFINSYRSNDLINENTLLITRKGTVGNSIFIKENKKYCASSEVFIIRLDSTVVDGEYLSEINLSDFVKQQYVEKNTGTIMPSISQNKLLEIKIPLPNSLEKQKQIVNYIKEIRKAVFDLNKRCIELQENALLDFEYQIFKRN
ncbi:restriction endonuclease subunit S [Flavobacterium urocaniciphilum]|uniref:restriction endonuclease subunit S n=1 Tax=Flavobacterium urocaniciphilum TaxID=1299341 RepID=UPI0015A634E9|nr:restriction endonuclease subunit S [Flavobacterium urocaniciphilum]